MDLRAFSENLQKKMAQLASWMASPDGQGVEGPRIEECLGCIRVVLEGSPYVLAAKFWVSPLTVIVVPSILRIW